MEIAVTLSVVTSLVLGIAGYSYVELARLSAAARR